MPDFFRGQPFNSERYLNPPSPEVKQKELGEFIQGLANFGERLPGNFAFCQVIDGVDDMSLQSSKAWLSSSSLRERHLLACVRFPLLIREAH